MKYFKFGIFLIVLLQIFFVQNTAVFADKESENIWTEVTVLGLYDAEASLPGSGDRVGTEDIRKHSYDDINEILRKVPGVYLREEDGYGLFPNISLRGSDPGRSQKVTLMEDGITAAPAPYSAPSAYYSPTAGRMSAVEVLKGSSQVKYGPHTTGGVVNYLSTPIPKEKRVYLKQLFGSDNELRTHFYAGNTVDADGLGKFGVLVEQYYRQTDGFKSIDPTPDFSSLDKTGFKKNEPMLKVSWEPASGRYQRLEGKFGYSDIKADETYLGLSETDFDNNPYRRYAATRFDNIDTEQARSYLRYVTEINDDVTFSLTGFYNKFQRNWFKLHNISGGNVSNLSEALAAGGTSLAILKGEAAGTLNVRNNNRWYEQYGYKGNTNVGFDLGPTSHELEIGLGYHNDYVRRKQNTVSYVQDATGTITSTSVSAAGSAGNRRQEAQSITSYIRDDIKWDKWTITPGFRYEYVNFEFIDFVSGTNPDTVSSRGEDTLTAAASGVGFNYDFSDSLSAFAGIHQGFSTPSPRDNAKSGLIEETSITQEYGVRFNDKNAFETELVYFYTDFSDLLVKDNIGGSGTGETENVGDVISQGVEFTAQYDLGRALKKNFKNPYHFTFTYTNTELDGNSNSTDPESIFAGGKDGNKVPYVPDVQLAFGTGLEWDKFGVYLDTTYVGETFTTANNVDNQKREDGTPDARFGKTDDFFVVDLSGSYQINDNAKAFVNLQNIGDLEYIVSRHPHGPRPGKPFTFTAGMELQF